MPLVRVILDRIVLPNPDDKLAAGKLSFEGEAGSDKIGDSALVFEASPGSTIFLAGDKWQKEVECEESASLRRSKSRFRASMRSRESFTPRTDKRYLGWVFRRTSTRWTTPFSSRRRITSRTLLALILTSGL